MLKETSDLLKQFYQLDDEVFKLSEEVMEDIKEQFDEIKEIREFNQYKVLKAMHAETTVISAPATNPRFARNRLVSSFPPILLISFTSPIFAIVKGIIPTSCSFAYLEF